MKMSRSALSSFSSEEYSCHTNTSRLTVLMLQILHELTKFSTLKIHYLKLWMMCKVRSALRLL